MSVQSAAIPIAVFEQAGQVPADWTVVERCPACGSRAVAASARLPEAHYAFGDHEIPIPASGIAVCRCGVCSVHYKTTVPAPGFLAQMFGQHAEVKWAAPPVEFSRELATLRQLWGAPAMDLLDIGAAGGALLEAHAASGLSGRRSAFDVMRYAGIERHLTGEFIEGFLDNPIPEWSREPYDVVTLLDVIEHFYRPQDAFENLRRLTRPGGLVFIETGNTESFWPRHYGINQWWYVRLLEHHVFWSRRSLEHMAAVHGFRIVYWKEGRHKSRRNRALAGAIKDILKTGLYCVTGPRYASIARRFGKQGNQPWFPLTRDHFQACLMRA
ncbi:MAG TPA: class I SAM-dependent methyltransferase [Burkholderiales bacterium]|nr:class I SAM-dependent methyltransferase [Burkholderiales bacterium]